MHYQIRLLSVISVVLAWTGLASLGGCGSPVQVSTKAIVAAENTQATTVRRIAVLPFESPRREFDITSEVEAMLASVQVDGKPYFTLVERARIQQIMREQKLNNSDMVNQATAAKLGQLLGAEGIYTGVVSRADVDQRRYQETRSRCAQYEQKKDKKGNVTQGGCKQWREDKVSCTEQIASFEFQPKLIRVETGTIQFSDMVRGEVKEAHCSGDEKSGLSERSQLLATARASAIEQMRRKVAPNYQTVKLAFVSSTEGIVSTAAKQKHESALEFAKQGRIERACELWSEALVEEPRSAAVMHNTGVCLEVNGRLDDALSSYRAAERLSPKPDKTISESITRVQARIQDRQRLSGQGVQPR